MAYGSANGYGAMAAAEFAREDQKLLWSLNTVSDIVSFLGPRPFGWMRLGSCCAKCGSAPGSPGHQVKVNGALRVRVSGRGVPSLPPAGNTQPLVAVSVPGRPGARGSPAIPTWAARCVASQRGSEGRTRWQGPANWPRGCCRYGVLTGPQSTSRRLRSCARGSHPSRAPGGRPATPQRGGVPRPGPPMSGRRSSESNC